jgi:multicomponent Na+:H+ antiporter subunit B
MIKRLLIILTLTAIAFGLYPLAWGVKDARQLSPLAAGYVENSVEELGTSNVVTAIVVSYRGLDTLGEVTVLFAAAAGVTLLMTAGKSERRKKRPVSRGKDGKDTKDGSEGGADRARRQGSELLAAGAAFLFPIIWLFGIYIFIHGHLTPGGGFQGGVVIASAVLLLILSDCRQELGHTVLQLTEALSGAAYVGVGLLGLWMAAGFLDPRFLAAGEFGQLFSAGAIPIIYSLIGIKVGAELTGIVDSLRRCS